MAGIVVLPGMAPSGRSLAPWRYPNAIKLLMRCFLSTFDKGYVLDAIDQQHCSGEAVIRNNRRTKGIGSSWSCIADLSSVAIGSKH